MSYNTIQGDAILNNGSSGQLMEMALASTMQFTSLAKNSAGHFVGSLTGIAAGSYAPGSVVYRIKGTTIVAYNTNTVTVANAPSTGGTGGEQGGTTTTLPAPANLQQTGSTTTSVTMSWDPVAGASGYRLRRNGSVLLMPGTATTYVDSGLAAGSSPSYEVQPIGTGSYATGPYSAPVTAMVAAADGSSDLAPPANWAGFVAPYAAEETDAKWAETKQWTHEADANYSAGFGAYGGDQGNLSSSEVVGTFWLRRRGYLRTKCVYSPNAGTAGIQIDTLSTRGIPQTGPAGPADTQYVSPTFDAGSHTVYYRSIGQGIALWDLIEFVLGESPGESGYN